MVQIKVSEGSWCSCKMRLLCLHWWDHHLLAMQAMVDCPALQTPTAATLWGKVLSGTVNLLEGDDGLQNGVQQDEDLDEGEYAGYSASFAPLHNAAIAEQDILPDVPDAKSYLASSLGSFSHSHQGQVANLITQHVPAELQPKLQGYLETARVSLVKF